LVRAGAVNVVIMLAPQPRPCLHPDRPEADAHPARPAELLPLVDLVGLKWLLAAEGVHLHVERAQSDLAYAHATLQQARASASATLRSRAEALALRLAPRD
jgi:hypothetical protein